MMATVYVNDGAARGPRTAHRTLACATAHFGIVTMRKVTRKIDGGIITIGDEYLFCKTCARALHDDYKALLALERLYPDPNATMLGGPV